MRVYMSVCLYACMRVRAYVCVRVRVHAEMNMRECVCVCVCVWARARARLPEFDPVTGKRYIKDSPGRNHQKCARY